MLGTELRHSCLRILPVEPSCHHLHSDIDHLQCQKSMGFKCMGMGYMESLSSCWVLLLWCQEELEDYLSRWCEMFSDHQADTSKEQQSVLPDPHSQGGYPLDHFPEPAESLTRGLILDWLVQLTSVWIANLWFKMVVWLPGFWTFSEHPELCQFAWTPE